jgi:uncharacterized membrane protein (DUF373 family)
MKQQRPKTNLIAVWLFINVTAMLLWKKLFKELKTHSQDENFLHLLERVEVLVSKVLSVAMVLVILESIVNLGVFMVVGLRAAPTQSFSKTLFETFGLFLNVLIALEILENITAYLKKHVIHAELVIATSLIAVARKIIILDLEKYDGIQIVGLGIAIFALAISYWIVKKMNVKRDGE